MYKDINFSLTKTELNDISMFEDIECIRQSVKTILLTSKGELHYFPEFGSNIKKYLFEKNNIFTRLAIRDEIKFALENYEPRINNIRVMAEPTNDPNEIQVELSYNIVSIQRQTSQTIILRVV